MINDGRNRNCHEPPEGVNSKVAVTMLSKTSRTQARRLLIILF